MKAVIVIEDRDDDTVSINVEFEPGLNEDSAAHRTAAAVAAWLARGDEE